MSYEMNFEMYVGKKEQRAEVLAVIRKALTEKGFEEFANNFVAAILLSCRCLLTMVELQGNSQSHIGTLFTPNKLNILILL